MTVKAQYNPSTALMHFTDVTKRVQVVGPLECQGPINVFIGMDQECLNGNIKPTGSWSDVTFTTLHPTFTGEFIFGTTTTSQWDLDINIADDTAFLEDYSVAPDCSGVLLIRRVVTNVHMFVTLQFDTVGPACSYGVLLTADWYEEGNPGNTGTTTIISKVGSLLFPCDECWGSAPSFTTLTSDVIPFYFQGGEILVQEP